VGGAAARAGAVASAGVSDAAAPASKVRRESSIMNLPLGVFRAVR
jgi:hypothetical protein